MIERIEIANRKEAVEVLTAAFRDHPMMPPDPTGKKARIMMETFLRVFGDAPDAQVFGVRSGRRLVRRFVLETHAANRSARTIPNLPPFGRGRLPLGGLVLFGGGTRFRLLNLCKLDDFLTRWIGCRLSLVMLRAYCVPDFGRHDMLLGLIVRDVVWGFSRPAMLVLSVVLWMTGVAEGREPIVLKGSDTMIILNRELTQQFMETRPDLTFHVEGRGSETGITALVDGTTDIAASSRAIRPAEVERFRKRTGRTPHEVIIAMDGLGVYVHTSNPVHQLTLGEFQAILKGDIQNWIEVGGPNRQIHVYNRDIHSGTRTYVHTHVLKGEAFGGMARDVTSTTLLTAAVARNRRAIGYGGIAYAEGTRIIRIAVEEGANAYWPTHENVAKGLYPLARPLYYYIDPALEDEDVKAYLAWVLDRPGQRVVKFVGYYPAPTGEWPVVEDAAVVETVEKETIEDVEEVLAPVVETGPILVTRENMREHGLDIEVRLTDSSDETKSKKPRVTVVFKKKTGPTIERISGVTARFGEDLEVPLVMSEDGSVGFSVSRALLGSVSLLLEERGEPGETRGYTVRIGDFIEE